MVLPASHEVPRASWYSGTARETHAFRLQGSHLLWRAFPGPSTTHVFDDSLGALPSSLSGPTTPAVQRRQACTRSVWALPRSLATTCGISELISFPEGTEMFHFP